jgi:hypothetical protein
LRQARPAPSAFPQVPSGFGNSCGVYSIEAFRFRQQSAQLVERFIAAKKFSLALFQWFQFHGCGPGGSCRPTVRVSVRDCAVSCNFVANDICKRVAFSQTSTLLGSRADLREICRFDCLGCGR